MKKIILILISIILLANPILAFTDVGDMWSRPYIVWASEKGYFKGYSDGSFRPKSEITNSEFIKVLSQIVNTEHKVDLHYSDVKPDAWYRNALMNMVATGLLKNEGKFNPDEKIIRAEAFRLIAGIYDRQTKEITSINFKDAEVVNNEAGIAALINDGIINGDGNGNLNPLAPITREEICKILKTAYEKYGDVRLILK